MKKPQPPARTKSVKAEVLWMGYSRKFGVVLPWIWGSSRKTCRQQYGEISWRPNEYVRRKVRIVPLSQPHKKKGR